MESLCDYPIQMRGNFPPPPLLRKVILVESKLVHLLHQSKPACQTLVSTEGTCEESLDGYVCHCPPFFNGLQCQGTFLYDFFQSMFYVTISILSVSRTWEISYFCIAIQNVHFQSTSLSIDMRAFTHTVPLHHFRIIIITKFAWRDNVLRIQFN